MGEAGCFYMIIENFRDGDPLCGRGSTDAGLTVWPGESTSPRESDRQASRLVFDASSLSGAFSISGGSRSPFLNSCTPFPRLPIISGRRPGEQRAEEALEVFQALRIAGRTGPAPLDRHGRLHAAAPAFAFARVRRILPGRTGSPLPRVELGANASTRLGCRTRRRLRRPCSERFAHLDQKSLIESAVSRDPGCR